MKNILLIVVLFTLFSCKGQSNSEAISNKNYEVNKSEAEWKKSLTAEEYEVLRKSGTERAHSGEYVNTFEKGKYVCAACNNLIFKSDTKFRSDCGWPSFDQAIKGSVVYKDDNTFMMQRTEVLCSKCGGHLGHVFDDGPKDTTGKRYCMNSIAMKFIPEQK